MRKSTRINYLKCLTDIYFDAQKSGCVSSLNSYAEMYGISNAIGTQLIQLGYIKSTAGNSRKYNWIGRAPDDDMVVEITSRQNQKIIDGKENTLKKTEENIPKQGDLFKSKLIQSELIQMDESIMSIAYERMSHCFLLAEKYHIPVSQKKAFIQDLLKLQTKKVS